jgi:hypothetical protein
LLKRVAFALRYRDAPDNASDHGQGRDHDDYAFHAHLQFGEERLLPESDWPKAPLRRPTTSASRYLP